MSIRVVLLPFSWVFALLAGVRNMFFNIGIFKQRSFKLPVVLVGNLSVGGTGKTPHVEYILRLLKKDYRLATLSRGYGRKSKGFVIAGKGSTSEIIGDEPMQYHSKFEDVTVSVCEDRVRGVEKIIDSGRKTDVIIMDDGYQHRRINPGLKILLTPYDRPFTRDFILPAGDLRESRSGYRRADCIVVTRCPVNLSSEEKESVKREIRPLKHQQVFFSSIVYDNPVSFFSHEKYHPGQHRERPVFIFTGIAHPHPLINYMKSFEVKVHHESFPDHHAYSEKDMDMLRKKFDKFASNGIMLTTEKDYQRIHSLKVFPQLKNLPLYYIPVKVQFDREAEFNTLIKNYVKANKSVS